MTKVEADLIVYGFMAALSVCGLFGWGKKKADEEEEVEAHGVVLDCLADADLVREVDTLTGKNLREQLTLEQVQELHERRRLLGMGDRRN